MCGIGAPCGICVPDSAARPMPPHEASPNAGPARPRGKAAGGAVRAQRHVCLRARFPRRPPSLRHQDKAWAFRRKYTLHGIPGGGGAVFWRRCAQPNRAPRRLALTPARQAAPCLKPCALASARIVGGWVSQRFGARSGAGCGGRRWAIPRVFVIDRKTTVGRRSRGKGPVEGPKALHGPAVQTHSLPHPANPHIDLITARQPLRPAVKPRRLCPKRTAAPWRVESPLAGPCHPRDRGQSR